MKSTIITIPGQLTRVTLVEAKGFSAKDLEKIKKAMCVISYVVNICTEFDDRLLHHKFTSTKDTGFKVITNIYNGGEVVNGSVIDNEIDLSLQYYNSWWSRVIGYTMPKSAWIWMNWKYHSRFSPEQMAGNLFHEWLHKLGYDHSSAKDHTSVPYALGYLMEELGKKYQSEALELMSKVEVLNA